MRYIILAIKTLFYCFSTVFVIMSTYIGYEIGVIMSPTVDYGTNQNYYYLFFSAVFFLASYMLVIFLQKILNLILKLFIKEKN